MKNKVYILLIVPEIDKTFDIYLPVNRKVGNIINMLNKTINEYSLGEFPLSESNKLYNGDTKERYDPNILVASTNIRNGSSLILIS